MKAQKTISTIALAAAMGVLIQGQTAKAAFTDNLADLVANGGSLTIGDKIFSGFSDTPDNLTDFNPADIIVTASILGPNSYVLTWTGSIAVAGSPSGATIGDLALGYTVQATDGSIFAIDQSYTGTGAEPGGSLDVKENVYAHGTIAPTLASSELTYAITGTGYTATGAILNPEESIVDVTKDIELTAPENGSTVSISVVEQSFDEVAVPETTTVVAGMLLLLPLGASTVKILRNRKILA